MFGSLASPLVIKNAPRFARRRVLKDKKPLKHPPVMKSGLMEKMFEVERRETQAANIIQGFWHKYLVIKTLRDNFKKGKKVSERS